MYVTFSVPRRQCCAGWGVTSGVLLAFLIFNEHLTSVILIGGVPSALHLLGSILNTAAKLDRLGSLQVVADMCVCMCLEV